MLERLGMACYGSRLSSYQLSVRFFFKKSFSCQSSVKEVDLINQVPLLTYNL